MRDFYQSFSHKDLRRYTAIEAKKLLYGGISSICRVLQCNDRTITRGLAELDKLPSRPENEFIYSVVGARDSLANSLTWMLHSYVFSKIIRLDRRWMKRLNGST
jgi:hypothetical protein